MGLAAQKQLAKGYEARDMQYGGRRKVVQLEAVELQEPPEKRMNWKSEPSYQIRDKAYPLSLGGIGKALRLLSAIIGGKPGSNRDHIGRGEKSLVWSVASSLCGMEHLSQSPGLGLEGREEELRRLAMLE